MIVLCGVLPVTGLLMKTSVTPVSSVTVPVSVGDHPCPFRQARQTEAVWNPLRRKGADTARAADAADCVPEEPVWDEESPEALTETSPMVPALSAVMELLSAYLSNVRSASHIAPAPPKGFIFARYRRLGKRKQGISAVDAFVQGDVYALYGACAAEDRDRRVDFKRPRAQLRTTSEEMAALLPQAGPLSVKVTVQDSAERALTVPVSVLPSGRATLTSVPRPSPSVDEGVNVTFIFPSMEITAREPFSSIILFVCSPSDAKSCFYTSAHRGRDILSIPYRLLHRRFQSQGT